MNRMYKKLFLFVVISIFTINIFAQVAADPNDSFYEDALRWELQGLIPNLPEMRPYSLQLVKSILETVMNSEDEIAAEEAKEYYDRYFGKFLSFGVETSVYTKLKDGKLEKQLDINPIIYGNTEVLPNTTISFEVTPMLSTVAPREDLIPKYTAPKYDSVSDNLEVSKFNLYTPYNAVVAYGTNEIYFQAGLNRNSFGNILDTGVVIGATAPHVGSLVFTVNKEKVNYQLAMLMLSASDSYGNGRYPAKYFYLHSLRYSFTEKFDFTIYETAITGPRFDVTYLMPIVPFMAMQQISGYSGDNLLIGVEFSYKPITGLKIFANGYADDIGFNDLVKFKLNTKLKMAVEAGFQYAPVEKSFCKLFSFDYTFLAPYMYSHEMYENGKLSLKTPNYQNYTSSKVSIGSMLDPNSDRLRFDVLLTPGENLEMRFGTSVIRHANINETLYKKAIADNKVINTDAFSCVSQYVKNYAYEDKNGKKVSYITDGSVFDFPNAGSGYFYYPNHNFLFLDNTSDYICLQNGVDLKYVLNFKSKGSLTFGLNYTLQFEKNVGVGTNLFYYVDGLNDDSEVITELNKQYNEWKSKFHDEWSNFISISLKYIY